MSSSESSSSPSPSPPASPEPSFHGPPDLERLVLHLVSAKRALSSTQHVVRANDLITSSRTFIEDIVISNAKNSYAKNGVDEQLDTLQAIHDGIVDTGELAAAEFKQTIARLDVANDRLQTTLAGLKKVLIDESLQKPRQILSQSSNESQVSSRSEGRTNESATAETKQRTLHDFVDEGNHEDVLASLRSLIDSYHEAEGDLTDNTVRFSKSIASASDILLEHASGSDPPRRPTPYDEPLLTTSALFNSMESHAAEMASSLQSLVSHYDLCVSALKHTEGGGEAARAALQTVELAKNTPGIEESLYRATVPDPMDEDERLEMLRVLENDAIEVEDVASEISERASEMEDLYSQLSNRASLSRKTTSRIRHAMTQLHIIKDTLPLYIDALSFFRSSWSNIQMSIVNKTQELVGFCSFYEQFLVGYKKLLREVDRRKAVDLQMRKVAEKASKELERLWESDRAAREEFVNDVGGFLPGDLAPSLAEIGKRWEVKQVEDEVLDESGD
jgi:autophagy-related protein 17